MVKKHAKKTVKVSKNVNTSNALHMWRAVAVIAVILLAIAVITNGFKGKSGLEVKDADTVASETLDYVNTNLLSGGVSATLVDVTEERGLYAVKINIQGQEFTSYVTQDGSLFFTQGMELSGEAPVDATPTASQPAQPTPEVTKADKPVVELFIMSHCPYGTQMEKGILPVVGTLGDNIDFKLRFVYYAMHGETEVLEQLNQYCIQKEQDDKLLKYLTCFLEAGKGDSCLDEVGIDRSALTTCTQAADAEFGIMAAFNDQASWLSGRYPLFNTDADLNQQYAVGGSPTLVVNGAKANSGRDSASLLRTVCAAFNEAPEECNTELSSGSPSPGFGFTETEGAAIAATCG